MSRWCRREGRGSKYPVPSVYGGKQHPKVLIGSTSRGIESSMPLSAAPDVISKVQVSAGPSRGILLSEEIGANFFAADVRVTRDSMLMLKATYHPNWRATVNGEETDPVMLMPSVVGIQLPKGDHKVRLEYRPRRLRVVLLGLGLLTLPLIAISEKWGTGFWRRFNLRVIGPISSSVKRRHWLSPRWCRFRTSRISHIPCSLYANATSLFPTRLARPSSASKGWGHDPEKWGHVSEKLTPLPGSCL